MSLIKVKARVKHIDESDMEAELDNDDRYGSITPKSTRWLYRTKIIREDNIYEITAYDSQKSVITYYDNEGALKKMIVDESIDSLYEKWEAAENYESYAEDLTIDRVGTITPEE